MRHIMLACVLAGSSLPSSANPTFTQDAAGSSLIVWATNLGSIGYRCVIDFDWAADSHQREHSNSVVDVPVTATPWAAVRISGAFVNIRFETPVVTSCSPIPNPPPPPPPPPSPAQCTVPTAQANQVLCGTVCPGPSADTARRLCVLKAATTSCYQLRAFGKSKQGYSSPNQRISLFQTAPAAPQALCFHSISWIDGPVYDKCDVNRMATGGETIRYEVQLRNHNANLETMGLELLANPSTCPSPSAKRRTSTKD